MAVYGVTPYATDTYGLSTTLYVSNPSAQPVGFGAIHVRWGTPGGSWTTLRLVRNSFGFPETATDGTILVDSASGPVNGTDVPVTDYVDSGLTPGKFYYYTVFVSVVSGSSITWKRTGDVQGLSVADHDYGSLLVSRLPGFWTNTDREVEGSAASSSLIQRFTSLLGYDLSRFRDLTEGLLKVRDADQIPGNLLPFLIRTLGGTFEPEISMRQNRVLLRNWSYLMSMKGTSVGVTGFASSLTGFGSEQLPLTNLMHNDQDSSFEGGVGRWTVVGGVLSSSQAVGPEADSFVGQVVKNGSAGPLTLTCLGDGDPITNGIPVTPLLPYTVSTFFMSLATSVTPTLDILWYDKSGALISTVVGTAGPSTTLTDWSCRPSTTGTAPANALYLGVRINYASLQPSDTQFVDAIQVEQNTQPTDYDRSRVVRVNLLPTRTNLVVNPGFDIDTFGWATTGSATMSRLAGGYDGGVGSCQVTYNAQGDDLNTTFDVTGGSPIAASVWTQCGDMVSVGGDGVASASFLLQIDFFDSGGSMVGSDRSLFSGDAFTSPTPWLRATLLTVSPDSATTATLRFLYTMSPTYPVNLVVDDVLVEESSIIDDYFDPRYNPGDVQWAGTAYQSESSLYPHFSVKRSRLLARLPEVLPMGANFDVVSVSSPTDTTVPSSGSTYGTYATGYNTGTSVSSYSAYDTAY